MKKLKVGIVFGGKSAEHEVSLQSASNIIAAIDTSKYEPVLIGIDKQGRWLPVGDSTALLTDGGRPNASRDSDVRQSVTFAPESAGMLAGPETEQPGTAVDVVFPVLHGPFGEDGTIQGLLKLANVAFVGSGVLGSAVGMDKDVMKRLLRESGIPVVRFLAAKSGKVPAFDEVVEQLGLPFFVKPANLGSSVGISKVKSERAYHSAVEDAFSFDRKILIEEYVDGREIECAVLGNDDPIASVPGEVLPSHEFYSYDAKYLDEHGAALEVPARLRDEAVAQVQALALKTFSVLACEGMGRVDFFMRKSGELVVNEINTIPGFTRISMYPRLWEASGIAYPDLVNRLLELALERFEQERNLRTSYMSN